MIPNNSIKLFNPLFARANAPIKPAQMCHAKHVSTHRAATQDKVGSPEKREEAFCGFLERKSRSKNPLAGQPFENRAGLTIDYDSVL